MLSKPGKTAPMPTTSGRASNILADIPADIRCLWRKPPLLLGEDPADFRELVKRIIADVKPKDTHEWLLTQDILEAEWDLRRLPSLRSSMLHALIPRVLIAQPHLELEGKEVSRIRKLVSSSLDGDDSAAAALEKELRQHGLTIELVLGAAFERTIHEQMLTDRLLAAARGRIDAAYRELERLRSKRVTQPSTEPRSNGASRHFERDVATA
jgi:hypothetical protein